MRWKGVNAAGAKSLVVVKGRPVEKVWWGVEGWDSLVEVRLLQKDSLCRMIRRPSNRDGRPHFVALAQDYRC